MDSPRLTEKPTAVPPSQAAARSLCARHLSTLAPELRLCDASTVDGVDPADLCWSVSSPHGAGHRKISCSIEWPALSHESPGLTGGEAVAQAICGLMEVHGRERGVPRRLGLDVVAAAAGMLGAQGVLATLLAQRRGLGTGTVVTSALAAGLHLISHHITAATCGDRWQPPAGDGPGPPFPTRDGHWVEIEALGAEQWHGFWRRLGVDDSLLGRSWLTFAFRQNTATCRLPRELHGATTRCTLHELAAAADVSGVAWCRVRDYGEVIRDPTWSETNPWSIQLDRESREPAHRRWRAGRERGVGIQSRALPLEGLRIVEVTTRIQGPLAGSLLRMLGAEVIKVEPPGGDPGREVPPIAGASGSAFAAYNHGKRRVELDYKQPAGRAGIAELVSDADVFLHNMRAGRAEELELGFEDLMRANPSLVYAQASGWGRDPATVLPRVATDPLVQAHAGLGSGLNPPDEPPFPSRVTIADAFGGITAAEAIVAALARRAVTARGSRIDTSLLASAHAVQLTALQRYARAAESRTPAGPPMWTDLDGPIPTSDGYLVVEASDPEQMDRLADACYVRAGTNAASAKVALIVERLRARPARAWPAPLAAAGVSCAVVSTDLATLWTDPLVSKRLESVDDACMTPSAPWLFTSIS